MKVLLSFVILSLVASAFSEPDCSPGQPEHQPHPTDCNKYYTCSNGDAVLQECPPGLWWSVAVDTCDLPENTVCNAATSSTTAATTTSGTTASSSSVPTEPTDTTTGTASSSIPTESTTGTVTSSIPTESTTPTPTTSTSTAASTTPPGPVNRCPPVEDPTVIIRYPHETNCDFYYKCEQGHPTLYTCTLGDQFSPTQRICRSKTVAGCDSCPEVEDVNDTIRLPHESNCHFYYLCQLGQPNLYQCLTDLDFSRMDRVCMSPAEARCTPGKTWY